MVNSCGISQEGSGRDEQSLRVLQQQGEVHHADAWQLQRQHGMLAQFILLPPFGRFCILFILSLGSTAAARCRPYQTAS
jgi:hypothetical protein